MHASLQLVKSVSFAVQVFLSDLFILPKAELSNICGIHAKMMDPLYGPAGPGKNAESGGHC